MLHHSWNNIQFVFVAVCCENCREFGVVIPPYLGNTSISGNVGVRCLSSIAMSTSWTSHIKKVASCDVIVAAIMCS